MKITKISVFKKPLPYISGELEVGDRSADRGQLSDNLFNSTVVVVDTDAGVSGCGESCPWGTSNLGGLPAMEGLAKALLGNDPRQLNLIEQVMDSAIEGHPYAKGPVDVACWDIFGKSAGVPVYMLLGGKLCDGAPLYRCFTFCSFHTCGAIVQYCGFAYVQCGVDGNLGAADIRWTIILLRCAWTWCRA